MRRSLFGLAGLVCLTAMSSATGFDASKLVVLVTGDGSATLSNAATKVALWQFDKTTASTGTKVLDYAYTQAGSATSEGFINLTSDGTKLVLAGYDAAPGLTGVAATTSAANKRVVSLIDSLGNQSHSLYSDAFSALNIRSAYSDGTSNWMVGSNQGVRGGNVGGSTSTVLSSGSPTNLRVLKGYGGDLYVSSSSGTRGIYKLAGMPTSGTAALSVFIDTSTSSSPYDFWFASPTTLYIADDLSNSTGVFRYDYVGGAWTKAYNLNTGISVGIRSVVGEIVNGQTVLYGTTALASGNSLVRLVDTGAASQWSVLATAATNTAFRGVSLAPRAVPEPASMIALGIGAIGLIARKRRK